MIKSDVEVSLIDSMGSDLSIVNSARVSFAKESELVPFCNDDSEFCGGLDKSKCLMIECNAAIATTMVLSKADEKLIKYLAEHNHWSPAAHTSLQFRIKAPMFVARQLVKHQVGGTWNEVSRRYVDIEPEFWFPKQWHGRPTNKKQGCDEDTIINLTPIEKMEGPDGCVFFPEEVCEKALETYNTLLKLGVAPEEARIILPLNTMTEWIWTGSMYFFARVCKLRLSKDAQLATREVVQKISDLSKDKFPIGWKYFGS